MSQSTGPKTKQGKLTSSQNAITHGFTSQRLLNQQEEHAFQQLHKALTQEYQPQTTTEALLVEDLANIRIRLNRFDSAEVGLFEAADFDAGLPRFIVSSLKLDDPFLETKLTKALTARTPFLDPFAAALIEEIKKINKDSSIDGSRALTELPKLIELIKLDCEVLKLSPEEVIIRTKRIQDEGEKYLPQLKVITHSENEPPEPTFEELISELTSEQIKQYISSIKARFNKLSALQALYEEALMRVDNYQQTPLPDQSSLDRLYRYRNSLEKHFSAKLSQLIQLQEMRIKKERFRNTN
jgi:hypothetical protein